MKKGKVIKWSILGLLLIVIAGVVAVFLSINGIIRSTVQTQGTQALSVNTTLGAADMSLLGGKLQLDNLDIGSPQGFSAPKMFSVGSAKVQVNYGQLRQDPVHIAQIAIDKPILVLEQTGGKFNIKALMDQMPQTTPPGQPAPSASSKPIKMIIDSLTVSNAQVLLRPGLPGLSQEYKLTVPTIDLKNVGNAEGNSNGADMKEVVMQILTAISAKAADSDQIPAQIRPLLTGDLSSVAKGLSANFTKQLGDMTKSLPDLSKGMGDIIKNPKLPDVPKLPGGLFGSDKDKKQP